MEKLSDFIGSVRGIGWLAAIELVYMTIGILLGFDAYPFPFLTLVLSLIALQFSQVIIVVQNRQSAVLEIKQVKERDEVARDLAVDIETHDLLLEILVLLT